MLMHCAVLLSQYVVSQVTVLTMILLLILILILILTLWILILKPHANCIL